MAKKADSKEPTTALAVTGSGALAAPDFLRPSEAPAGLENMRPQDMVIPRIILMQGLSPKVVDRQFNIGDMVNSLTNELIVSDGEERRFVPVFHYVEWIKWGSRDAGEGMLDRSLDPKSAIALSAARGDKNQKGKLIITEYHNFIVLFPDYSLTQPIVIGCSKTNYKKGKQLLTMAKYRGKYDLFAGAYTIKSGDEENKNRQKYKVFNFENAGWVDKREHEVSAELYKTLKDAFQNKRLRVDDDTGVDHTEANPAEDKEL